MYADLMGNHEKQRIKSLCDNKVTWHNQLVQLAQSFQQFGSIVGQSIINAVKPFIKALNAGMQAAITFAKVVSNALGFIFGWKYEEGGGAISDVADAMEDVATEAGGAADGTGKAADNAKKLKSYLMGIDELNVLEPDTGDSDSGSGGGGGGGGGADASGADGGTWVKAEKSLADYMSDLTTLRELGKWIGDTWSDALNSIPWNEIQQKAYDAGDALANFLDGLLVDSELIPTIGTTIAEGLDTIVKAFQGFGENFEWSGFGTRIGEGINNFFNNFDFQNLAHTINVWANGILDMMIAAVDKVNWATVGTKIGEFLAELDLVEIGGKIVELLVKAIDGAIVAWNASFNLAPIETALLTAIVALKFTPLGKVVKKKLEKAVAKALAEPFTLALDLHPLLVIDNLTNLISVNPAAISMWGSTLLEGLWKAIEPLIPDWVEKFIGDIGAGIVLGAASGSLLTPLGTLAGAIIGGLIGALKALADTLPKKIVETLFNFDYTTELFQSAVSFFDQAKEAFDNQDWGTFGIDIIKGIVAGLAGGLAFIGEPIVDLLTAIGNKLMEVFKMHSPSKAMEPYGENILKGVLQGMVNAFTNIPTTVAKFATEVMSNVKKSFGDLKDKLIETGKGIVEGLVEGIEKYFDLSESPVVQWAKSVFTWFTGDGSGDDKVNEGAFSKIAKDVATALSETFGTEQKQTENPIVTWAKSIFTWFTGDGSGDDKINESAFGNIAKAVIGAFNSNTETESAHSQSPIETWASNVIKWFTKDEADGGINGTTFGNFAKKVIEGFGGGVTNNADTNRTSIETWGNNVKKWFWGDSNPAKENGLGKAFKDFGNWLAEGLANGIKAGIDLVETAASLLSGAAKKATVKENKIGSPSKVYYEYGGWIVEGFANGISDNAGLATKAAEALSDGASDGMKAVGSQVSNTKITTNAAQTGILGALSNTVSTQNVAAATQAIPSGVKNSWDSTRAQWNHDMEHWWTYNVEPYFTYGRWQDTTSSIQTAIAFNLKSMIDDWTKNIATWWNTQVAAYFTYARWQSTTETIQTSIADNFNAMLEAWTKNIASWWNNQVAPYFTSERWNSMVKVISDSVSQATSDMRSAWVSSGDDWFNNEVSPLFARSKWDSITANITDSIVDAFGTAIDDVEEALDDFFEDIEDRIDDLEDRLDSLSSRSSRGSSGSRDRDDWEVDIDIDVDWEDDLDSDHWDSDFSFSGPGIGLAGGGTVKKGQWFIARENGIPEMVGKFGSQSGVANNMQIVSGIASGVSSALSGLVASINSLANKDVNMPTYSSYRYGTGFGGEVGMSDGDKAAYAQQIAQAIVVAQSNGDDNRLMREQNDLLREIADKDQNVYLDGRSVSKQINNVRKRLGYSFQ